MKRIREASVDDSALATDAVLAAEDDAEQKPYQVLDGNDLEHFHSNGLETKLVTEFKIASDSSCGRFKAGARVYVILRRERPPGTIKLIFSKDASANAYPSSVLEKGHQ